MKKLSLKKLKLEVVDMLQRNELKSVFGGYGGGTACENDADPIYNGGGACADGTVISGFYVCPEHEQAYLDMLTAFCGGNI
tara:strand:+ start:88952 stop:89194 length:243 start_codon:yes stop_codon:yes gene_type:complete